MRIRKVSGLYPFGHSPQLISELIFYTKYQFFGELNFCGENQTGNSGEVSTLQFPGPFENLINRQERKKKGLFSSNFTIKTVSSLLFRHIFSDKRLLKMFLCVNTVGIYALKIVASSDLPSVEINRQLGRIYRR